MHPSTLLLPFFPLLPYTTALQLPALQPFLAALPVQFSDYIPPTTFPNPPSAYHPPLHNTKPRPHQNLRKRQSLDLSGSSGSDSDSNNDNDNDSGDSSDTCPRDFTSCANLGAASLCCSPSSRCAPDNAGHVACCPNGAACTGTIGGVLTAGTVDSSGNLVGAGGGMQETGSSAGGAVATQSTTTTQGFQGASSGGDGGLVVASSTLANGDGDGGDFVMNGGETVATPAAANRGADIPVIAKAIIRIVDFWI